jgi:hypothetical protein
LTAAFVKAVSDYHRMQSAQIAALQRGEGLPLENLLQRARRNRDAARAAIVKHEREHGC